MRHLGIALMGLGGLLVVAAFVPHLHNDVLKYVLTGLGPCVGGLGAWLKQEAEGGAARAK
ncbi:MAG TPA: hypothetical protein VII78_08465 [Myxococcota bacterium]|jgi:hypothetical protein